MMDPMVAPGLDITERAIICAEGWNIVSFGYQSSPQDLWKKWTLNSINCPIISSATIASLCPLKKRYEYKSYMELPMEIFRFHSPSLLLDVSVCVCMCISICVSSLIFFSIISIYKTMIVSIISEYMHMTDLGRNLLPLYTRNI